MKKLECSASLFLPVPLQGPQTGRFDSTLWILYPKLGIREYIEGKCVAGKVNRSMKRKQQPKDLERAIWKGNWEMKKNDKLSKKKGGQH